MDKPTLKDRTTRIRNMIQDAIQELEDACPFAKAETIRVNMDTYAVLISDLARYKMKIIPGRDKPKETYEGINVQGMIAWNFSEERIEVT